jgi:hypothetical protein
MRDQLAKIRSEALSAFENAADLTALDALRVQYLGKKGELTGVLKMMGKLTAEERPVMGQLANDVRAALETALEERTAALENAALEQRLLDEAIDVTIPGKTVSVGHRHPMYIALDEIKEIFTTSHMLRLGAEVKLGALALRGGYGLTTSPEKNFEGSYRSNFSFGLGYSTKGSFFADFAVRKNIYNTEYYMPYSDYIFGYDEEGNEYIAEPVPELSIMRSDWKILLTLGWRF